MRAPVLFLLLICYFKCINFNYTASANTIWVIWPMPEFCTISCALHPFAICINQLLTIYLFSCQKLLDNWSQSGNWARHTLRMINYAEKTLILNTMRN